MKKIKKNKKYNKKITGICPKTGKRVTIIVDVYDVLKAFKVTCPALQHIGKKILNAGSRGHKGLQEDTVDIVTGALRAVEINKKG